jgi:long-subunit acyl-CoA synthetase (AMP-forming)
MNVRDYAAETAEIDAVVAGDTLPKAFLRTAEASPGVVGLRRMVGEGADRWEETTYQELRDEVAGVAAGLQAAGLRPGQTIVLMMRNRPEFHVVDLAATFLRATPVSIYNSSSAEELQYLVDHAEAEIAVVEDVGFLERFLKVRAELPRLRRIFVIEPPVDDTPDDVAPYADLGASGRADLEALAEATDPGDLATLIYTSGTTGPPKGVMISQQNVVYTCEQLTRCYEFALGDDRGVGLRYVSYLPMAHIAERISSHYNGMRLGFTITCCPDPAQIATYAREVHPEVIFGVPRVWEKVYLGVNAALGADPEKKQKFDEAVAAALPILEARRRGTITPDQQETWDFLDAVAFSTVRGLVGLDALRLGITGAAPIPRQILEWFNALGIPLTEIYGMSETTGPITWEARPDKIKPGTVGPGIPGCEVRIAEDGEVICRGGNVFQGYFKAPDKTADTLIDGWLHSGDIGVVDDDGFVKIIDRKKELIITSGGKNISPANLEAALKTIPLIGQACAIGDNRKFVSALLVLDPDTTAIWAKANRKEALTLAELARDPDVIGEVQSGVNHVNQQFAQVEQIKRFTLIGEEWLPDSDVLTPTSKLKRRGVHAHYAAQIEDMYADTE